MIPQTDLIRHMYIGFSLPFYSGNSSSRSSSGFGRLTLMPFPNNTTFTLSQLHEGVCNTAYLYQVKQEQARSSYKRKYTQTAFGAATKVQINVLKLLRRRWMKTSWEQRWESHTDQDDRRTKCKTARVNDVLRLHCKNTEAEAAPLAFPQLT